MGPTFTPFDLDPSAPTQCGNCDATNPAGSLNPVRDPSSRLEAGGTVPAGECPACGCLAYLISTRRAAPCAS